MSNEKKDAYEVGIPLEDLPSPESIDQEAMPAETNAKVDRPAIESEGPEDGSDLPDLFDPEELAEVGLTAESVSSDDPAEDAIHDLRAPVGVNAEAGLTAIESRDENIAEEADTDPDGLTANRVDAAPDREILPFPDEPSNGAPPEAVVAADTPSSASDEPWITEEDTGASDDRQDGDHRVVPPDDDTFIDQDLLAGRLESLGLQIEELKREFEGKLKYDAHKDEIIDRLHTELQEYKQDIIKKYVLSIVMDVVKVADDIRKWLAYFRSLDVSQRDPRKLFRYVEAIPSDLEDVFYWHGVKPFSQQEGAFDPSRQRAIKKISTDDPALDKSVAHSIRPGYEWETKVIRQEMVAVYVYKQEQESLDTGMIDE